jgi:hypothetical protein
MACVIPFSFIPVQFALRRGLAPRVVAPGVHLSQRGTSRGVLALMAALSLVVLMTVSREGIHSREDPDPRGGVAPPQLVDGTLHGPSSRWTVVPPVPLHQQ